MTVPALLFGILVSTMMGAMLHLLSGGGLWRLGLFIGVAWLGFWAGHFLGGSLGWTFLSVGPLNLGAGLLGGLIALLFGYWLSLVQVEKK